VLVADRDLLWSAAHRPGGFAEEPVLALSAHLDTPERARALYALTALRNGDEARWELQRLRELHELVQAVLSSDDLGGNEARGLAELHAMRASELLVGERGPTERLASAPRAYVVRTPAGALARHARLLHPTPVHHPRVTVSDPDGDHLWVDVAWQDRPGLLAAVTHGLASAGLSVDDAVVATWPDGAVLDSFRVPVTSDIDVATLARAIETGVDSVLTAPPLRDAELDLDQNASPWHTVCEVRATDRHGLLAGLATAFAASGILVRSATMRTEGDLVIDRFEVTDRAGGKLSGEDEERLRNVLATGATVRRRRIGKRLLVRATSS
jgi:UTP:GlnB (protein PII) uridylyltransferase